MKTLTITMSGEPGCGKSTARALIKEMLLQEFNIRPISEKEENPCQLEYNSEEFIDKTITA